MTPSPLDLLSDDLPHGTVEGERAGCVTPACPSKPLTCMEVARLNRTDMRFKRLYKTGLRGQELFNVYHRVETADPLAARPESPKTQVNPAPESEPEPAPEPEPEPEPEVSVSVDDLAALELADLEDRPVTPEVWAKLESATRDRLLCAWYAEGLESRDIAERVGSKAAGASSMVRAARRRAGLLHERRVEASLPNARPTPPPVGIVHTVTPSQLAKLAQENEWIIPEGQLLSRVEYPELYAVIGTNYGAGGDEDTFRVPDLREHGTAGGRYIMRARPLAAPEPLTESSPTSATDRLGAESTPATATGAGPVPAAEAVARYGVPPMQVADIPGPQLVRAWAVLDREKRVLLVTQDVEEAVSALAEAWRRQAAQEDAS